MKWRCEWCGKPHAENDPPCDNCGHGEFEKAVVPAAPEADEQTGDAYGHVWVCTECGNDHPKNTPPCDRCGHTSFERREIEFDEDEVLSEMLDESRGDRGPGADVSYLDVLDAKLVAGFLVVVALVAVAGLGYLGVADPLGLFPAQNPPTVDAPGNDTRLGSLDLETVEAAYVETVNERRTDAGESALTSDESVTAAASYLNKNRVESRYTDGTATPSGKVLSGLLGDACSGSPTLSSFEVDPSAFPDGSAKNFGSERAFARALVENRTDQPPTLDGTVTGVDVHVAPDGTVFVTQLAC